MSKQDSDKKFIEFLQTLIELTYSNIKFLQNKDPIKVSNLYKYKDELDKVQDLINSFDLRKS